MGAPRIGGSLLRLAIAVAAGYSILAMGLGYWQVVQSQSLSEDPRNPLVVQASRAAPRGQIITANGEVLAKNSGSGANSIRVYPYPDFAPVLGYKSLIFGTAGLERAYDQQLIGLRSLSPGDEFFAKFRGDRYDPADLLVSLDVKLQQAAVDALGSDSGAVVAIEPSTGRILAMVSGPTFDPNRIADPDKAKAYLDKLQQSTDSPLLNRATQGQYVPGSVFKIVTATAGIGSGEITTDTTFLTSRPNTRPASWCRASAYATPGGPSRPTTRSISSKRPRSRATSGTRMPVFRSGPRTCSAGPPSSALAHPSLRSAHLEEPGDRWRRTARWLPGPGRAGQRRLRPG